MSVIAEISAEDSSKIEVRAPSRFYDLCKTLPASKFNGKAYRTTLTWPTYLQLTGIFRSELELGPQLANWVNEYKSTRIDPAMALRESLDADGFPGLYGYQKAGVEFLATAHRAILADGLGSGKTFTSFATIRWLYENRKVNPFPVLIVCPNSTKISWQRAVETIWPGLQVQVISGTATQRRKQFKSGAHVFIINWEALKSHSRIAPYGSNAIKKCVECGGISSTVKESQCQAHVRELNEIEFGAVIADEAHRMKSPSALTTRALKAATGNAEYRFALTGTPIANAPDDLWSILNWMYPDAFPSRTKFIDRYLDVSYNVWGGAEVIGIKQALEKEFFGFLDPILRRMPKEVVLPFLPPVVYERRVVTMSPKQKKAYNQMRDQYIAEIDGDLLVQTSPLTRMTRLLQLASSYMEVENIKKIDPNTGEEIDAQKVTLAEPSCKLDAFIDDLDDFGDESVVVFSPSKQMINLLAARFDKMGIKYGKITGDEGEVDRQIHMDNFQNGHTQFILCTTGAGGTGVTLTRAAMAVYLGRPFSGIDSEQSEGRVHRLGSEIHDKIVYRDYVSEDTVESGVFEILDNKNVQLQSILRDKDLMRKIISGESTE